MCRDLSLPALLISITICGCGLQGEKLDGSTGGFRVPFSKHALDSNRFIVFAPQARGLRDCEPLPVLLFLHGNGERGTNGLTQIHNNFGPQIAELQEHFPFIAVCIQTSGERRWTPDGIQMKQVLKILDDVLAEYNADPDRVILTGVSSGGTGAWQNAANIPERFAAVVPLAADSESSDIVDIAAANLPTWLIYNAGDGNVASGCVENREELLALGQSPIVIAQQQEGHNAWSRGYASKSMWAWCLEQNRDQRSANYQWVRREELLSLAKPEAASGLGNTEDAGAEVKWSSGAQSDDSFSAIPTTTQAIPIPSNPKLPEVHFDLWPSPGTESRIAVIPQSPDSPSFIVSIRDTITGFSDVRVEGGAWIADLDPVSQQQLIAGEWNDIRISVNEGALELRMNGWKADPIDLGSPSSGYQFRLLPPKSGKTAFRYVRYRTNSGTPRDVPRGKE